MPAPTTDPGPPDTCSGCHATEFVAASERLDRYAPTAIRSDITNPATSADRRNEGTSKTMPKGRRMNYEDFVIETDACEQHRFGAVEAEALVP
jgi:hypothetical protein